MTFDFYHVSFLAVGLLLGAILGHLFTRTRVAIPQQDQTTPALMQMQATLQQALHEQMMKISALEQQRALQQQELMGTIENLRTETGRLDRALSRPQPRGAWGEVVLEKILELSGLIKNQHYATQLGLGTAQDHARPDVVVYLPGKLSVVIDAKVPMSALLDAEADAPKRHAAQLKMHIQELGSKGYWDRIKDLSPEFVVLFVPDEGMLSGALHTDPSLFEFAARQKVMLTSPHNLISLLRTIAFGWRQEDVSENARQIADQGKKLYEAVRTFSEHLEKLGRQLNLSVETYNKSVGSLEVSFLPTARRIRDLGAVESSGKDIPNLTAIDVTARTPSKPELLLRAGSND
jgi:DNA recombination protein RmuC